MRSTFCMAGRTEYSSLEARVHLSEILRQVEEGEEITITRRGKPVAIIVSFPEAKPGGYHRILDRFRAIRKEIEKDGPVNVKELID